MGSNVARAFGQGVTAPDVCRICARLITVPVDGILACTGCRSGELLGLGAEVARYDMQDGIDRTTRQSVRLALAKGTVGPRHLYIRARLRLRRFLWLRIDVRLDQ
jgi:hypothetical protein